MTKIRHGHMDDIDQTWMTHRSDTVIWMTQIRHGCHRSDMDDTAQVSDIDDTCISDIDDTDQRHRSDMDGKPTMKDF